MAASYHIDVSNRLVYSRGWDILTDEELLTHATRLPTDSRFQPDYLQICDFRDVADVRVTSQGIRRVGQANPWGRGSRRAMVVASDLIFGLVRMYELMSNQSPDEFQIFRELEGARKWLALPATWSPPAAHLADAVFDLKPTVPEGGTSKAER